MDNLDLFMGRGDNGPFVRPIDTALELGAYEEMWSRPKCSFKSISEKLFGTEDRRPSDFVEEDIARTRARTVMNVLRGMIDGWFGFRVKGDIDYPERLLDALHPIYCLYYQGHWDLVTDNSVAIVGTRNPSEDGIKRTRQLVRNLLDDKFRIVSGLAKGVDTAAHTECLRLGGKTIAVIGTPIGEAYPKENTELQEEISKDHLLISQVPVSRYNRKNPTSNRFFFPERNKTMSALTKATIIVEAGETSGTLTQARAALQQGRRLFILNSCFENPALSWPRKYEELGAVRVRDYDDIRQKLVR